LEQPAIDRPRIRLGTARGRYFRENFAQGGFDLVQIIPELVTNADAAIAASGRPSGQIVLSVDTPDPEFLDAWRVRMRALRSPALLSWKHELRCTDDGEGVDADLIDRRLGALGVEPPRAGQRGLFGRGLRDVWLAQGAGRIEGVRAGMLVESWFFPAPGDEPYAFMHVREAAATTADLAALGLAAAGTRVTVPLAGYEGRPGSRHLYGEVVCEAIETLQRDALEKPRPELVVRVDRSGLNEHHPIVAKLYAAIDRILKPIVAAEERRAGAHLIGAPRAVTVRDQVGLRALNDLLKAAFDQPGSVGAEPGQRPAAKPAPIEPVEEPVERADVSEDDDELSSQPDPTAALGQDAPALWFKQSPLRLHPGETRTVTLLANPAAVPFGTAVELEADQGLAVILRTGTVPEPTSRGTCAVRMSIRAKVTVEPGSRLAVLAAAGDHTAQLEILIVRHRASGWVREIARKNEDQTIEAEFDPETGVVTVYEGRREFRELERAARRAGLSSKRAPEYVPYRMLEVEAAANAVYGWAAEQILVRRLPEERPADPVDYAAAVRHEAQTLRHRAHHRLMQAFLEPEVFDGSVAVTRGSRGTSGRQLRLVESNDADAQ
jgi:hypothetical protein